MNLDDDDPLERAREEMLDAAECARKERLRGVLIVFGSMLAGALLLILLAVSARSAHAAYGTPQERAVCLPEFKRLCPSLTDDSWPESLLLCVRVNRSRFSPACSAVLEQRGL